MRLDLSGQCVLAADGSPGERLERSLFAVVVALGLHWWRKGDQPATPTVLSRLLGGTLRPESVYHVLWQAHTFLWGEDGPVVAVGAGRRAEGYRLALREGEVLVPGAEALDAYLAQARRRGRSPGRSAPQARREELARAEALMRIGHLNEAAALLLGTELRNEIGQHVSGAARQRLLVQLDRLEGQLFTQQGRFTEAIAALEKARARALRIGEVGEALHAAFELSGALRMNGVAGVTRARALCEESLVLLNGARGQLASARYGMLARWAGAVLASPMLIQGDAQRALDVTARSLDALGLLGAEAEAGEAETRLRRVRAYLSLGDEEHAQEELTLATACAARAGEEHWIHGWVPRYQADVLLQRGQRVLAERALLEAWQRCAGHGFQRLHLAVRLWEVYRDASAGSSIDSAQRGGAPFIDGRLSQGIAALHRQFCRVWPRQCPQCGRGATLAHLRCLVQRGFSGVPAAFFY